MAQVSVRVDDEVKRNAEATLNAIGIPMSTAVNVFLKAVAREHRIPFELNADPFYSDSNMRHIKRGIEALDAGKGVETASMASESQNR